MKKLLTGLIVASTLMLVSGCNEDKKEFRIDAYGTGGENFLSPDEVSIVTSQEELLELYRNGKIVENAIRERLKQYLSHSSLDKAVNGEVMAISHGKTPSQIAEMARNAEEISKVIEKLDK